MAPTPQNLPAPQSRPPERQMAQFLSFTLAQGVTAAVPIAQVMEVIALPPSQIVALPHLHQCIMGVYNWRGEMLWMIDLAQFLGYDEAGNLGHQQRTAVAVHVGERRMGWVVERVEDTFRCEIERVLPPPPLAFSARLEPYLQGYLLAANGEMVLVLDVRAIFQAPLWQAPR